MTEATPSSRKEEKRKREQRRNSLFCLIFWSSSISFGEARIVA